MNKNDSIEIRETPETTPEKQRLATIEKIIASYGYVKIPDLLWLVKKTKEAIHE